MDLETLKVLAELLHGGGSAILLVVAWVALRAGRVVKEALETLKRIEQNQRTSIATTEKAADRQEANTRQLLDAMSNLPLRVAGIVGGRRI
jgi:hypothetical protein